MKKQILILLLLSILSCGSDDITNTRAYVEGKAESQTSKPEDIEFSLLSDGKTIAQTTPTSNGTFVLSGPLLGQKFSFKSNKKIRSIVTSQSGLQFAADSLSVDVPSGVNYLFISKIEVK